MFKRNYFIRKIVVSILSTLLICLFLAIMEYRPAEEGWRGVGNHSFWGLYLMYLILVSPVYLIGGNIYSILVDYVWNRFRNVNRVYQFISIVFIYAIGGCALLILYVVLLFHGNIFNGFTILFYLVGMLAGVIYYLLDSLIVRWNKVIRK